MTLRGVGILLLVLLLVFPIYWMLVSAVTPGGSVLGAGLVPEEITFEAFRNVFTRTDVGRWFYNSFLVTGLTVLISVPLAALAGYALSRFKDPGIYGLGYALLTSRMLPSVVLIIPLYYVFVKMGLINSLWGLVLANTTMELPFGAWMMKGFFDSIPRELEEAAEVDGCGLGGALVRVVAPLSLPGLTATTIHSAILAWGEFLFASSLLQTPPNWTVTVGLASFQGEYQVAWSDVMAATAAFSIPILLVFALLQRYLVSGLTAGAVKS